MAAALLAAGCGSRPLPELPALRMEDFVPDVRARMQAALDDARANPEQAATNGELGMLLQAYDLDEAAAACYERAAILDGDEFRWPYYHAVALETLGRDAEAVAAVRDALELDDSHLPARLLLAGLLRKMNQLEQSKALYEAVISDDASLAAAHYGLGLVLAAQGQPSDALESHRKATDLAPDSGAAHYALALAYRSAGEPEKARQHMEIYQKGNRLAPEPEDPLMKEVRGLRTDQFSYLEEGQNLWAAGDLLGTVAAFRKVLEYDPQSAQAHVNLLGVLASLNRFDEAEQHYRQALEINPNLQEVHYNWGVALLLQKRLPEARAALQKALERNPNYADAHHNLGYVLEQLGDADQAVHHYHQALKNEPNHRMAHFHLGSYLVSAGQYDQAIEHLEESLTPEDERAPRFHYVLADAYTRAGNRPKAIEHARKARDLATRFGQRLLAGLIQEDLNTLESMSAASR